MLSREYLRRELEREWTLIETAEKKVLEEEKKKIVTEWVGVEDAQREYNSERDEYVNERTLPCHANLFAKFIRFCWISLPVLRFEKAAGKHFTFMPADEVVVFNVGGQLFKSTVKVWTRDRFSILAQLCTTRPKLGADEDGSFFFDRDFWVFQFILAFLRDSTLPDSVEELRELYCEASFYRLGLLQHAIEARMIGEDAMAASVLSSRPVDSTSTPSAPVSRRQPAPKTEESKAPSPVVKEPPPLSEKYRELPDPFGFTSKK
ncbi:hypothetical protein BBJ28_00016937 [Nothophytophthora sp. Chile5]|nr:hypothetical protein BBJ28_00016937 [Nothophytophthora sp. Chile5]